MNPLESTWTTYNGEDFRNPCPLNRDLFDLSPCLAGPGTVCGWAVATRSDLLPGTL